MPSKSKAQHNNAFVSAKCESCSATRSFTKYDVNRGRNDGWKCRSCGVRGWHNREGRGLRTPQEKRADRIKAAHEYYKKNQVRLNRYSNQWRENKRKNIIDELGGKCRACGETDQIVLDIDHINDDGAKERRETKRKNIVDIISANPESLHKYQVLCKNCNWRKEYNRRKSAVSI